ncbi:IS110 family RNA-guided transposase [Desulfopila aestuarii]|uniref:Transposase IS116/IS110/IS902 family protein n=1 Tax=Desulfopila aestuarii DSM 18488 TaxID=1121416 RepID=A0A1M7YKR4_9BACT|nr:Transposase IS116/IS110/IS902 family protein [Desulfopila aestuarii DSM 18488]
MAKRKKKGKTVKALHVLQPNGAGIDIGATEIYIAVPEDRTQESVRCFGTFTEDLHKAAQWLKSCSIDSIAMESTGVYWIPVFQILDSYGYDVILVNARHVKNVPGRKTDVQDCQWLQYLHSVGLLRGSFRPSQDICAIRSLLRHRDTMVKSASSHVQHIQKSLTQMNLQIHNVISDIVGVTGLSIIDAIVAGERDREKLANLTDPRIRADRKTILKSLEGDFRPEHLFTLKQALSSYRHYQQMIRECDLEIEIHLNAADSNTDFDDNLTPPSCRSKSKAKDDSAIFDLRRHLHRLFGTDLTLVDGISTLTSQVLYTEIGPDLSMFPTANHFCSWLGLSPQNKISGGKTLSSRTRPGSNRAAQALRISANTLIRSKSYLGDYYRRMRTRLGAPKVITATAHKLARIIYFLIKNRKPFDETIFAEQERKHQEGMKKRFINRAKSFGLQLIAD